MINLLVKWSFFCLYCVCSSTELFRKLALFCKAKRNCTKAQVFFKYGKTLIFNLYSWTFYVHVPVCMNLYGHVWTPVLPYYCISGWICKPIGDWSNVNSFEEVIFLYRNNKSVKNVSTSCLFVIWLLVLQKKKSFFIVFCNICFIFYVKKVKC